MKKGLFAVCVSLLFAVSSAYASTGVASNCIQKTDGCNTCSRVGTGDLRACTMMACLQADGSNTISTGETCLATSESPSAEPVMCPALYAPVCASVQVQCIQAPCPAIEETFSNTCVMGANPQATYLHDGVCGASGSIVGNDKDEHGCIGSAGYVWNTGAQQCVRPWETPMVACTKEYMPVCGLHDGLATTYGNMCTLKAAGARVAYAGECVAGLAAGEGYRYRSIASLLDNHYLAKTYTPIQAANYTQTLIDKVDSTLQVTKMKSYALHKLQLLKKFLQTYKNTIAL